MDGVEVRISRTRALLVALLFVIATAAFTPWMLRGVASEAAFQQVRAENESDRRCLACDMAYQPYRLLTWTAVLIFNGLFGSASVVGLWRAFGPPTLVISADGRGRYILPWRSRAFRVPERSRIGVTRFGLTFDPPLEDEAAGKRFRSINIRSAWTNRSPQALAAELRALNPTWTVVT